MGWTGQTHQLMWTGQKYRPIWEKMTTLGKEGRQRGGQARLRREDRSQRARHERVEGEAASERVATFGWGKSGMVWEREALKCF